MRRLYLAILVVLGLAVIFSGKVAFRPYASQEATAIFVLSLCAFAAMLAVLLLCKASGRIRDLWLFRVTRLWMDAKERELRDRSNGSS